MTESKTRLIKTAHASLWVLWALLTLTYKATQTKNKYNQLFGKLLSYSFFYWFELIFMFGGGWLLLAVLIKVLPNKLAYLGYVIVELLFISIITVHLIVYFYQ